MRNTILGTILILACLSCKKEDQKLVIDPGVQYIKEGFTPPPAIRIFASSGEVKDAAIWVRYSALDTNYAYDIANSMARNPSGFLDTIFFESPSRAVISAYSTKTKYDVVTKGSDLLLTSVDTITGYVSGTEMSRNLRYFLPDPRILFYGEAIYGVAQGYYTFSYTFQARMIVKSGGGQTIQIPFLLFSYYQGAGLRERDFLLGSLDPSFFSHIPAGDTVAVRQFASRYTK